MRRKQKTPEKKIDKKYLEKIRSGKKGKESQKMTDQKRLDLLYKYDDFFKMRVENIKTSKSKKEMNLNEYQKEIVFFF